MADQGLKMHEQGGVVHIAGVLNEYADFSPLLNRAAPLTLNLKGLQRLNSIGIRNLLKFLAAWGDKGLIYDECPAEFIDQVNMIPSLLGVKNHAVIRSMMIPFECESCDYEEEVLGKPDDYRAGARTGNLPTRICSRCKGTMNVLTDSFFTFLTR